MAARECDNRECPLSTSCFVDGSLRQDTPQRPAAKIYCSVTCEAPSVVVNGEVSKIFTNGRGPEFCISKAEFTLPDLRRLCRHHQDDPVFEEGRCMYYNQPWNRVKNYCSVRELSDISRGCSRFDLIRCPGIIRSLEIIDGRVDLSTSKTLGIIITLASFWQRVKESSLTQLFNR